MINEAIILAGGLGTRLRTVVPDQPKCLAPIKGKPFLSYLINFLKESGISKFIFSVGYMHELIEAFLDRNFAFLDYKVSIENQPLGTGGAIRMSCDFSSNKNAIVCNGDTLFKIDLQQLIIFHNEKKSGCSLCLKPMRDFDRYGVVELNANSSIKSFKEKKFYSEGLINGGVYALDIDRFKNEDLPEKFSFEKDYLEKNVSSVHGRKKLYGIVQDEYFIDIGIPEDYEKAQIEL